MTDSPTPSPSGAPAPARAPDRLLGRLEWIGDFISALALFALMAMGFVDVVGRDLFDSPVPGMVEVTELLMALMIFAVLPSISRRRDHVVIDLLDAFVPRWLVPVQRVFGELLGAITFAVIAWQLWDEAGKNAEYGDITPYFEWPLAPFVHAMAVLAAIAAAGFLAAALGRAVPTSPPPPESE
ncbi:MAG: TRAP transporter small permease [Burkholderiaceae bacterium]|nr:TRAP transporter small permease [Burkholderiaceae bacterium]